MSLGDVLSRQNWMLKKYPFPHLTATNVFTTEFYRSLEDTFHSLLSRGLSTKEDDMERFTRRVSNYGAYSIGFSSDMGPLSIFSSREWHALWTKIFAINTTLDIDGGFHHHPVNSWDGWLHHDFALGYFTDAPNSEGINLISVKCDYKTGRPSAPDIPIRKTVRAISILFYLCNEGWKPGDGGETGLYLSQRSNVKNPAAAVPPINNSLVAFPCTPFSFHSYMGNRRIPRNAMVMFMHQPFEDAAARWGEESIQLWAPAKETR